MLLERPFPDATTCLFVGRGLTGHEPQLARYDSVAWIVDAASATKEPSGLRPDALQILTLETIAVQGLQPWLDRFVAKAPRHLPSLYVSDDLGENTPEAYQTVLGQLHFALEGHHRARVTRQKDGFAWQRHLLENAAAYVNHRLPASWAGALRGLPAFVCGAGPSLDVSGPHLARVASQGVIFAADSALRSLDKLGVTADFVVSVDAAKTPGKCLPADHSPARVVLSAVSPPAWSGALPEASTVFLSSNLITLDWLATHGIARTPVSVVENCGATGLELARFLGCSPIYLFGLDLALDANQPTRRNTAEADASLYANSGFDAAQEFPRVPGNCSPTVPTHVLGDWHALDNRLASWPEGLVCNVTDRGARLRHTPVIAPNQLTVTSNAEKSVALANLSQSAAITSRSPFDADTALLRLQSVGARGCAAVPRLLNLLEKQGPAAVVAAMRQLFSDQDFGRGLGAFSMKVMPHLVPPIQTDHAFWRTIIGELQILSDLANHVGATVEPVPTQAAA
jgi:hypothetical protein